MRVTLDFDGRGFLSKFRFTIAWLILKVLSRDRQYGRLSAFKGYHLKAHGFHGFRLVLFLRLLLGDDRVRVRLDMERKKKPKSILWTVKDGVKAGSWCHNLREVIG